MAKASQLLQARNCNARPCGTLLPACRPFFGRSTCTPCTAGASANVPSRVRLQPVAAAPDGAEAVCPSRRALLASVVSAAGIAWAREAAADGPDAASLDGITTLINSSDAGALSPAEKLVYNQNRRIQTQNRVPPEFPGFVREGFNVKVVADGYSATPSGLIYKDFEEGQGSAPVNGQEIIFQYTGYNESGTVIDTSFRQGRPAQTRLGIAGLIPGFEEGVRSMKPGGKRRFVVPPALGPPVGPSTFFSAKQCEVFDVELLSVRTCQRRQVMMFSDVVCE